VVVATPQFDVAQKLLSSSMEVVATPSLGSRAGRPKVLRSFPEILRSTCFHDDAQIAARGASWEALYGYVRPDVIVGDHAPAALLAAQATTIRTIVLGTGFSLPAHVEQFPDWRPELNSPRIELAEAEAAVLTLVNRWLEKHGLAPLDKLSDLYYRTSAQILATLPAIDCCAPRDKARYFGIWPAQGGSAPDWPKGKQRVLAYVKPFANLPKLLDALKQLAVSAIVVCPGADQEFIRKHHGANISIVQSPLDLQSALAQCDLAIGHGSHGFAAQAVLSGKPQLLIPQVLEQRLTAERVVAQGAGLIARDNQPETFGEKLQSLLTGENFRNAAAKLASECAPFQTPVSDAVAAILGTP
jgi:UDP:flavonoid glycosyltransferase YjiC (YdhE family)